MADADAIVSKLAEVMKYVQRMNPGDRYLVVNRSANQLAEYARNAANDCNLIVSYFDLSADAPYTEQFSEEFLHELREQTPKGAIGLFDYSENPDWNLAERPARVHLVKTVIPTIPISWAHSPGIDIDMALNGALQCNHKEMAQTADYVMGLLADAEKINITAPGGTELEITLPASLRWQTDCRIVPPGVYGENGVIGNIPMGETWIERRVDLPVRDSGTRVLRKYPVQLIADGILVCDVCVGGYAGKLSPDQKLYVQFRKGVAIPRPDLCKDSALAERIFGAWKADEARYGTPTVAEELGIGFNERARPTGNMLETEKMKRTIHVAPGNIDVHEDMLFENPTMTATCNNGLQKAIMVNGDIVDRRLNKPMII